MQSEKVGLLPLAGTPWSNGQRRRRIKTLLFLSAFAILALLSYSSLRDNGKINNSHLESQRISNLASTIDDCTRIEAAKERFACQAKKAWTAYNQWLSSQSITLHEAKEQYERKYRRPAPAWFDIWFQFARENNVVVIDDFDQLEADLAPIRRIPPKILDARLHGVAKLEKAYEGKIMQSLLTVRNGHSKVSFWHDGAIQMLQDSLKPIVHLLPDLEILINWDDRPINRAPLPQPNCDRITRWGYKQHTGLAFQAEPCPSDSRFRSTNPFPDIFNGSPNIDVCDRQRGKLLSERHGFFQWEHGMFNFTVPVLSTAKASTHHDILRPHQVYAARNAPDTVSWEEKSDTIYWRGSNSGQVTRTDNWRSPHRARFVLNAQMWNRTISRIHANKESVEQIFDTLQKNGDLDLHDLDREGLEALSKLPIGMFDVAFTNIAWCGKDAGGCDKLKELSPIAERQSEDAIYKHKFLFDTDGAGMSCRFYNLLHSNSVVLKTSIFNEWHSDRLFPWIHYVPVDVDHHDVPKIIDFLLNDRAGRKYAKKIRHEAQSWVRRTFRPIDLSVYYLRLFFEYHDAYKAPGDADFRSVLLS